MKSVRKLLILLIFAAALIIPSNSYAWPGQPDGVYSYIYGNPLRYNNDNIVWTTEPGEQRVEWNIRENHGYLQHEYFVNVNSRGTNLKAVERGEHSYTGALHDTVYIGKWAYGWPGQCIHGGSTWMGVTQTMLTHCGADYQNRWIGYCADCGQPIGLLVTGSQGLMQRLNAIPNESRYYYLCPFGDYAGPRAGHMEQGAGFGHRCKGVSANRYSVSYIMDKPSSSIKKSGDYEVKISFYYYNNATKYENGVVVPRTDLETGDSLYWKVQGYKFVNFHTADGTVVSTWLDLQNLQPDSVINKNESTMQVYADWEQWDINLVLEDESSSSDKTYTLGLWEEKKIPDGEGGTYKITLDANGGALTNNVITVKKEFDYWNPVAPFYGSYDQASQKYTNTYKDENHATTVLKAVYYPAETILPTPKRPGYEFLGWEDEDGNLVAKSGDTYTANKDATLKARWNPVSLALTSIENYVANNGFGACDLSWVYTGKTELTTFKAYRSEANINANFVVVKNADSVEEETVINDKYTEDATYIIPENGFYEIKAFGGKGSDYETYKGGNGGMTSAKLFLKKGQVITIKPGTAGNGINPGVNSDSEFSGGTATNSFVKGSSGGAATVVYIDGELFTVAGGGGAAGSKENGHPGGSTSATGLLTDASTGMSKTSAGGGGYLGGVAGTYTVHTHGSSNGLNYNGTAGIDKTYDYAGNLLSTIETRNCYRREWHWYGGHGNKHHSGWMLSCGKTEQTIEGYSGCVNNTGWVDGHFTSHTHNDSCYLILWNKDHTSIVQKTGPWCNMQPKNSGWVAGKYTKHSHTNACTIYHHHTAEGGACYTETFDSCGVDNGTCGYRQWDLDYCIYQNSGNNFVVSTKGAFGGSNYIDENHVGSGYFVSGSFENRANINNTEANGDGFVTIKSVSVGFQLDTNVDSVITPDVDAPEKPSADVTTEKEEVTIDVDVAKDNGTIYYFQVNSYNMNDDSEPLIATAKSNVTYNKLTSGIKKLCYKVDTLENTVISAADLSSCVTIASDGTARKSIKVMKTYEHQWCHIVYVDLAGNVSETLTVDVGSIEIPVPEPLHVHHSLLDPTLTVENGDDEGIYIDGNNLYVKADGKTVVKLKESVKIPNAEDYFKINKLIYKEDSNNESHYVYIPTDSNYTSEDATLINGTNTNFDTINLPIVEIVDEKNFVAATQGFTLKSEKIFDVIPRSEATCLIHNDATNFAEGAGYKVYGDNTAPDITVTSAQDYELGSYLNLGQVPEYKFELAKTGTKVTISADDYISGLKSVNTYLGAEGGTPLSSKNGYTFTATENGIYELIVIAVDNVGNEAKIRITITVDLTAPQITDHTLPEDNDPESDDYIPKEASYGVGSEIKPYDSETTSEDYDVYYYTYGWVNHDLLLKYSVSDASDLTSIILYKGWDTSTIAMVGTINGGTSGYLHYNVNVEGIDKYYLEAKDKYGHIKKIYITTKIDYSAPEVTGLELITADGFVGLNMADHLAGDGSELPITVIVKANDAFNPETNAVSGLKEFTLSFNNTDNGLSRVYSTDATKASAPQYVITKNENDASALITLYDGSGEIEELFTGTWTVDVVAIDNVKNQAEVNANLGFFKLKAKFISRNGSDEYIDGNLKITNGNASILKIETDGYVDLLKIDFTDFYNDGYTIFRHKDGESLNDFWYEINPNDPAERTKYNKGRVTQIEKTYDFVKPEKDTSHYTVYYEIISPYIPKAIPDGGVYKATIQGFKGITFDANGKAITPTDDASLNSIIINKGMSKDEASGEWNVGEAVGLEVKAGLITEGSVVDGFITTIEMVK